MVSQLNKKQTKIQFPRGVSFLSQEEERRLRKDRKKLQEVSERLPNTLRKYKNYLIAMKRLSVDLEGLRKLPPEFRIAGYIRDDVIKWCETLDNEYTEESNNIKKSLQATTHNLTIACDRPHLRYNGIDGQRPDEWLAGKLEELEKEIRENDYQDPPAIVHFLQGLGLLETEEPETEEQFSSGLGPR